MEKVKELKFIKGSEYKGNDDWMHYLGDEDAYFFLLDNKVVAEAVLYDNYDYIRIYDFQVDYSLQYKGIGREAIKNIMDYAIAKGKKGISGESTSESLGFWGQIGAILKEEDIVECSDEDDEILTDFTLDKDDFIDYYEKYLLN